MCIIVAGETQPDSTKLINIPVTIQKHNYTLSLYVNNYDLKNDSQYDVRNGFNYNTFNWKKSGAIMVVPYPLNKMQGKPDIGLVDISTDAMKNFRRDTYSCFPQISRNNIMLNSYGADRSVKSILKVHDVGNYKISVAYSISDLLDRLDWNVFNKPANFNDIVGTFKNTNLYKVEYDWFYIVATTQENIKDDGFGVLYPKLKNDAIYFPTAHEQISNKLENVKFDVECYAYTNKKIKGEQYKDTKVLIDMLRNIDKTIGKFDSNVRAYVYMDIYSVDGLYKIEEKFYGANHNLYL